MGGCHVCSVAGLEKEIAVVYRLVGKRIAGLKRKLHDLLGKRNLRKVLPLSYSLILVIGGILTLVYAFVPGFVTCTSIFGERFCTPTGIFLMLIVSLPGYLIAGNVLFFIDVLPSALSLLIVALTSFIFYFLLGLSLEKFSSSKLTAEKMSKIFVVGFFVVLVILVLILLK